MSSEELKFMALNGPEATDEKLEQVRNLLFGDAQRRNLDMMDHLQDRLREMEKSMIRRYEELEMRLLQQSAQERSERAESLHYLGSALSVLGEDIRRMADQETDTITSPDLRPTVQATGTA